MVPEAGLEPAQSEDRGILSPLCLPIPPLRQELEPLRTHNMEATPRFELGIMILQTIALPLGDVAKIYKMERETRFELATTTLATWSSTTELLPLYHEKQSSKLRFYCQIIYIQQQLDSQQPATYLHLSVLNEYIVEYQLYDN